MKKLMAAIAVAAFGWTASAQANEPIVTSDDLGIKGLELSANVAVVSEYFFRGISQSDDTPALQGGFDISHSTGLYAGVWGSNVDFNDGDQAQVELDYYAGFASAIFGVSYDIGFIYYNYPGALDTLEYDFFEFTASLGYDVVLPFVTVSTTAGVNYTPDNFGDSGNATYFYGEVEAPVGKYLTLGAHVGRYEIDKNNRFALADYTHFQVSASVNLFGFDVMAAYKDTTLSDTDCGGDACGGAVWLSVSRSF